MYEVRSLKEVIFMAITLKNIEKWSKKNNSSKLIKALSSNDITICTAAITALGKIKEESSMYALIGLLQNSDKTIRGAAVDALSNMGNGRSLEFVRQMWSLETDEVVKEKAKEAIKIIKLNVSSQQE